MSGAVEQRDDLDACALGRGEEAVHLALGPFAAGSSGVGGVAGLDGRADRIAGIGRAVYGQRHIVQQEAHSVVSDRKHDMGVPVCCGLVEKGLDPVRAEVFAAAVQHGDLYVAVCAGCERGCRKHAQQHAQRQQKS